MRDIFPSSGDFDRFLVDFWSIFAGFSMDFRWISDEFSIDFRSIFYRFLVGVLIVFLIIFFLDVLLKRGGGYAALLRVG